ncbi:MAG: flagellar basal body rod protein FlgC [Ignavibacteriales bacterium]|nr:flagellar basal body rod protein FlgC [Ignavibacteriales bacterium]
MNFNGFNISAKGMSIQRKKMDLVAENIANMDTTKAENGKPYQRKFLIVNSENKLPGIELNKNSIQLRTTDIEHIRQEVVLVPENNSDLQINGKEIEDSSTGSQVFMPEHPDANEKGYVTMPNVNIITEMVDMIAASRGYESNLTAFNASKQMAKDSLEI